MSNSGTLMTIVRLIAERSYQRYKLLDVLYTV